MKNEVLSLQDQKILETLRKAGQPLSAYDLLDRLRKSGVRSPPTVYRALDRLTARGLAHRVESLNAFVACCHDCGCEQGSPSPLAICTGCGQVEEINDPAFARVIKKLGSGFLAQVNHKVLEVSGLCHACTSKPKRGAHV